MSKDNVTPAFPTTEEHGFNSGMHGMAALIQERDALKADAERYRWIVKHAGWYRNDEDDLRDNSTKLAINVAYGADLSCEAMRDLAIENAMKGKS